MVEMELQRKVYSWKRDAWEDSWQGEEAIVLENLKICPGTLGRGKKSEVRVCRCSFRVYIAELVATM